MHMAVITMAKVNNATPLYGRFYCSLCSSPGHSQSSIYTTCSSAVLLQTLQSPVVWALERGGGGGGGVVGIGPETLRVIHQNNDLTVQRGLGQQYIILELFESFSVEAVFN